MVSKSTMFVLKVTDKRKVQEMRMSSVAQLNKESSGKI
jgi:hypothetical protein